MFAHKFFDVELEWGVDPERLRWPTSEEAKDDSGLGCNRQYADFRGLTWTDAQEVYQLEGQLIGRIEEAADPEDEASLIDEEQYEDPDGLMGLDIGVASSVVALSASRCVPFSSCNGGAFGGGHHEIYPLVAFCAREPIVPLLLKCAEAADVGLVQDEAGHLVVYASDVRNMRRFADSLVSRRSEANNIRYRRTSRNVAKNQLKLL